MHFASFVVLDFYDNNEVIMNIYSVYPIVSLIDFNLTPVMGLSLLEFYKVKSLKKL